MAILLTKLVIQPNNDVFFTVVLNLLTRYLNQSLFNWNNQSGHGAYHSILKGIIIKMDFLNLEKVKLLKSYLSLLSIIEGIRD